MPGRHEDDGGIEGVADYAEAHPYVEFRRSPVVHGLSPLHPPLLTLDDLTDHEHWHLADHELTEHDRAFVYPDDPDDDDNPITIPRQLTLRAAAPNVVDVLRAGGVVCPQAVADVAASARLELAAAATLVEKESGGGRHAWGHDAVNTGECYAMGAEVTIAGYRCFRASPVAGWQGVAETQLTYKGYIYACEKRNPNGAADTVTNLSVGFETLAAGIRANGIRTAYRAYNGSGPAAEKYADDALARLARWRARLASAPPSPVPAPAPPPAEVDVGTPEQNRDVLLRTLLPDPVLPGHQMNVGDQLSWACAHAAYARQGVAALGAQVAGLQAAVSKLADAVGAQHGVDPTALKAAVTDAVDEHFRSQETP